MNANSWNFLHANGTVKPHLVKSFHEPAKEAVAKESVVKSTAAAKKK